MLTPSTSARRDSLQNASCNSARHTGPQYQLSLGAGSNSPKLPSLSPLQNNRNGNASNNSGTRLSGTDNSSSPGGSNSQSLPPPLKMPYRGSEGEDGFLELATRSTAQFEEKVGESDFDKVETYKVLLPRCLISYNASNKKLCGYICIWYSIVITYHLIHAN